MHVEASSNDENKKNILLEALFEGGEEMLEKWYTIGLNERQRQKEALERARAGDPIIGGRASRASWKAHKHSLKKKKRHFLKQYCKVKY